MNYRNFGNTSLKVSEIGFGAWAIGGNAMIGNTAIGWGKTDDAVSIKAIHAAMDQGINFFDTADIYGLGHSEELIGKTLSRENVVIATKVGNVSRNEQFTVDYTKEYIINACESSLRRLKVEAIDYYQLHTARIAHLQNGECIAAMQQLQQQGKIRYWGISLNTFHFEEEVNFFFENKLGNGFQLVLNMINQKALPTIKTAAEKGYGIIARMPLQFGLLTGKFDNEFSFPKDDHRSNRVTKPIVEESNRVLAAAWDLCRKYDCNKMQLALSYILSHAAISTVIPGIRTPEQAVLNTTGLIQLEEKDIQLIESMHGLDELMNTIEKQG
jgi:aryl-alcohol dehydrogenase-like predicted oxidoreductase